VNTDSADSIKTQSGGLPEGIKPILAGHPL